MRVNRKNLFVAMALWMAAMGQAGAQDTFCNPLNLEYRFNLETGTYREAADPMVVLYQGDYYLFASKSGGYWWSEDFADWHFVAPDKPIDIEKYAPAVWQIGEWMYYTSSESGAIYRSKNPKIGRWYKVCDNPHPWNDPWIFVDDDQRVYAYWGSGESGGISCCELDPDDNFKPLTEDVVCIKTNTEEHGYEVGGDNNEGGNPWTEGAAMFKHEGKYYLTYAVPGTQLRSYCDGYYVSDSPMGPFTVGKNSPATFKSRGFVTGVGHGGLFTDKTGRIWTIDCVNIANKHWFERRLAVFPVTVEEDGLLHTHTALGDYPLYVPGQVPEGHENASKGWNLLSYGKKAKISSLRDNRLGKFALDEDIRTFWSAKDGSEGQWLSVDLGTVCTVNAVQPNFYEHEAVCMDGRDRERATKYVIECSEDEKTWQVIVDRSGAGQDLTHDYTELPEPVEARYVRITNKGEVPGGGCFALSDFRVFGTVKGDKPTAVGGVKVERSASDRRCAHLSWDVSPGAEGYLVRFGIAPDKLWNHYMVWGETALDIRSLMTGTSYYYRVDALNGSGVTEGTEVYDDQGAGTSIVACTSEDFHPQGIYTLNGIKIPSSESLRPGIYIVDGNPVAVR